MWMHCGCGSMYQPIPKASQAVYTQKYYDKWKEQKMIVGRHSHLVRTYFPIIEETVWSREMLDVGFGLPYVMEEAQDRGWISTGIDLSANADNGLIDDIIREDVMEWKPPMVHKAEEITKGWDLVWCHHVLEGLGNPREAILKMHELTNNNGILFIATPDPTFVSKAGRKQFVHFTPQEVNFMWSMESLCKFLEGNGFEVIMQRRNYTQHYPQSQDMHILAQKR